MPDLLQFSCTNRMLWAEHFCPLRVVFSFIPHDSKGVPGGMIVLSSNLRARGAPFTTWYYPSKKRAGFNRFYCMPWAGCHAWGVGHVQRFSVLCRYEAVSAELSVEPKEHHPPASRLCAVRNTKQVDSDP